MTLVELISPFKILNTIHCLLLLSSSSFFLFYLNSFIVPLNFSTGIKLACLFSSHCFTRKVFVKAPPMQLQIKHLFYFIFLPSSVKFSVFSSQVFGLLALLSIWGTGGTVTCLCYVPWFSRVYCCGSFFLSFLCFI